ncbi:MAG: hypothetical protein UU47_C0017G0028 [candidate division TM6 bacterium GW2011_GWE2_41_16]|nr:MAG: hypothetical protein UU47_C0017G0028 [candidate division TM6 bacterium GW2011_GWE2_41_16]
MIMKKIDLCACLLVGMLSSHSMSMQYQQPSMQHPPKVTALPTVPFFMAFFRVPTYQEKIDLIKKRAQDHFAKYAPEIIAQIESEPVQNIVGACERLAKMETNEDKRLVIGKISADLFAMKQQYDACFFSDQNLPLLPTILEEYRVAQFSCAGVLNSEQWAEAARKLIFIKELLEYGFSAKSLARVEAPQCFKNNIEGNLKVYLARYPGVHQEILGDMFKVAFGPEHKELFTNKK